MVVIVIPGIVIPGIVEVEWNLAAGETGQPRAPHPRPRWTLGDILDELDIIRGGSPFAGVIVKIAEDGVVG